MCLLARIIKKLQRKVGPRGHVVPVRPVFDKAKRGNRGQTPLSHHLAFGSPHSADKFDRHGTPTRGTASSISNSSSRVSDSRTIGVAAVTVAVRGPPSSSAIYPKNCPDQAQRAPSPPLWKSPDPTR